MDLGQGGDPPHLGQPAAVGDVGLDHAAGALRQELVERRRADEALARRDRRAHRPLDGGDVVDPLRPARLLEPEEVELLERCGEQVPHARARPGVAVDHDVDVVADGIAHRGDAALGMAHGSEALERPRRRHRHRLERREALLDHAGRQLAEALRLAALVEVLHLALAEMAVEANVIAHRPAPELVARDAVHLAEDVPQCDVDAAHRRAADDVVAVPEVLAEHHLPEVLDPGRVLADDQLGQILDGTDDRPRVPLERRLAPAVETVLVGDDANEHPVPHPRIADVRLDRGDLHAAPLSPSSSATLSSISRPISLPSTLVFVIP